MSTSIPYGGYLPPMSAQALYGWGRRVREQMKPVFRDSLARTLGSAAAGLVDRVTVLGSTDGPAKVAINHLRHYLREAPPETALDDTVLSLAWEIVDSQTARDSKSDHANADSVFDWRSSLICFPVDGKILAIPRAPEATLREIIALQPEWTPYPYWDGDPPDGVSGVEWRRRRHEWDTLPRAWDYQAGLHVSLCSGEPAEVRPRPEEIVLPPLGERATLVAENLVEVPPDVKAHPLRLAGSWLRSKEYRKALDAITATVLVQLIPDLNGRFMEPLRSFFPATEG